MTVTRAQKNVPASPPPTGQASRTKPASNGVPEEAEAPATSRSKTVINVVILNVLLSIVTIVLGPIVLGTLWLPSMITRMPSCTACALAVELDEGAGVAVEYAKKTFLVKDADAATAFIADPSAMLPLSSKLSMYTNSEFWMNTDAATLCSCA